MRALRTDAERVEWSRRYRVAMHRFVRQGKSASVLAAARLGRRAAILGLEPLDVARSHEQALAALTPPGGSSRTATREMIERAKNFFEEVIAPIEATHCAALDAEARIDRLTRTLRRRTEESCVSARQLELALAERQAAEVVLKKAADQNTGLLAEAQGVQKHLRHQMHAILSAQECERQQTSRELRDEIAQALLAIDFSLLALKALAGADTERLEKEIANAQRLVEQYAEEVREKER